MVNVDGTRTPLPKLVTHDWRRATIVNADGTHIPLGTDTWSALLDSAGPNVGAEESGAADFCLPLRKPR
jgi:hypothetical protein